MQISARKRKEEREVRWRTQMIGKDSNDGAEDAASNDVGSVVAIV